MMTNPTRLFDILPYRQQKFGDIALMAAKESGNWKSYTAQQVQQIVNTLSANLLQLGLSGNDYSAEGADKVAILSANRPEWIFVDLACQQAGLILCPIYPTTNPIELEYILNDASIKCVFASNRDLYEKVDSVAPRVASLRHIFTFEKIEGAHHWGQLQHTPLPAHVEALENIRNNIQPEQLATIIYTSGTTGFPKGVMLSHANIVSNILNSVASFPFLDSPGKKVLSFLPLNHIFERLVTYIYFFSGNSVYYAESLETIGDNLKEIKPAGFCTVPRLLEKVFEKIMEKGHEQVGIKKKLFFWATELGLKYDNLKDQGFLYNTQLKLANKIVFSKWREGLGGNIEFIISGGAACQERLLRVFNAAGIPVFEGYGPTENSPVISVNRNLPGQTKFGTVGPPIIGQEVALAEDGEIMVKGPSVMVGYYKKPELTAETMRDGWLLTGDIGIWEEAFGHKFLKITDRKKELFKTSGGKYVAPQPLENKLKESPLIEQVMIVGAERKYVAALIIPGFPSLKEWMRKENIPFTTNAEAIRHPQVLQHYKDLVKAFNTYFNPVEQVKKFELLPQEWTIDSGELTPTLKIKRKVVMEKFKDSIERMYD
ncbi:MAG TPA: long-chain fatty acid--CoA ligase [Phnomibacter sp.]|nr:long-chain fatty acid--CoA ligase [Phnomibacter sp.]